MAAYYHAIVKLTDGNCIKFRNISNLQNFITYVDNNYTLYLRVVFIYRLPKREAKEGYYYQFYTNRGGLQFPKQKKFR